MISNGEELQIFSEATFRQRRTRTVGGRVTGNITLIQGDRSNRETSNEVAVILQEIMSAVAKRDYIDEATGKTRFSEIAYDQIDYTPELILEFVKEQGYTKKVEWQECPDGNKYYSNAHRLECIDWVVEQVNLDYKKYHSEGDWNKFIEHYGLTSDNTKNEVAEKAVEYFGSDAIIVKVRDKGWFYNFKNAKVGMKDKDALTPDQVRQFFTENNLIGKTKNEARNLLLEDNKSSIKYASQRVVKAYVKMFKSGEIEELLFDARSLGSRALTKRIIQLTKDNQVVKIWDSLELNASEFNRSAIDHILKGRGKTSQGFVWKYEE